jgi:hypothetical protein
MKKLFTFVLMAALAVGTAMANWQPSDTEATPLDKEGTQGQVQMKTIRTDDGKIILSWLRPERVNDKFSYVLHLQIFDANGNAMFGDEGIIVCDKPTRSWTTDYALDLAPNGDIILGYNDSRNDPESTETTEVYRYRYTQQGEPVWDADGVLFPSWPIAEFEAYPEDVNPVICVSGDNIYAAVARSEYSNGYNTKWELVRLNQDGTPAPTVTKTFSSRIVVLKPAPEGMVYCLYDNPELGLDAELLDEDLVNNWNDPITVEPRQISNGRYMPTPLTALDADGNLFISYRVLESFTGYQVVNHLTPEGEFFAEAPSCNNSIDGDAGTAAMGVKDDLAFVAWEYDFGNYFMNVSEIDAAGDYCWPDDRMYGVAIDENDMWGFTPVKVIPQEDGWVLLYGNSTSWNGANFMVVKMDEIGNVVWTKQICEKNFKSSGFSIAYDENYAYIFYTQEEQYDNNWNVIPGSGGMFVMCVDIVGDKPSAVQEVQTAAQPVSTQIFTLDGKQVSEMDHGVYIIRMTDANGNVTSTKVRK